MDGMGSIFNAGFFDSQPTQLQSFLLHHQQQQQAPRLPYDNSPSSAAESPEDMISMHHGSAAVNNENGKRPAPSAGAGGSRKKARKSDSATGKGGEDDIADSQIMGPPAAAGDAEKSKTSRGSRACTVCRRLKMKCVGAENGPPCKRCSAGNYECIFEESNRGKRSTKKSEQFQRSLKKMERTIATVLQSITSSNPLSSSQQGGSRSPSPQYADSPVDSASTSSAVRAAANIQYSPKLGTLPDSSLTPLGLLAEASLQNRREKAASGEDIATQGGAKLGVANDTYFKPGPMTILPLRRLFIERQIQPEMLSFTSTDEVVALFKIFFERMNDHAPVLDKDFHSPSLVCSRSPFLLTTICAIAAKFYTERPELYTRLETLARKLAFTVPERGYKSVEIVQAYLLLSLWGSGPSERYELDKTWMLLGMGIRMATDLNLHRKHRHATAGITNEKEMRNAERTWIMCFILDRSFSAQLGKPYCITEDSMVRNLMTWYHHPAALPTDAGLSAYAELQRVLSRSLDFLYAGTSSGLQVDCDYLLVVKTIEAQFMTWRQEWYEKEKELTEGNTQHRSSMGKFYFNYAMLVINSFGLQNAMERSGPDTGHFFARCHFSASAVLTVVRDELAPTGSLKYSVDSHFVQISYALLSLLKLLRPEFRQFFENEDNTIALIKITPDILESIAAGPLHTPALYATFLRALIKSKFDAQTPGPANEALVGAPVGQHVQQTYTYPDPQQMTLQNDLGQNQYLDQNQQLSELLGLGVFTSEMGPVADLSTFPPTMQEHGYHDTADTLTSMNSILSGGNFWDSMLIPGYSGALEGLSGGFVYGAGGSGLITPHMGGSPVASRIHTPNGGQEQYYSQHNLNVAFDRV